MRSRNFKHSLIHAKNHSTDQLMHEHVALHLIYSKCIPILLYGLEACPLTKPDLSSSNFVLKVRRSAEYFGAANWWWIFVFRSYFYLIYFQYL